MSKYIIKDKKYWSEDKLVDDIKSNMINLAESIEELGKRKISVSIEVSFFNKIDTNYERDINHF